jgi:carbamoyl-phosphate synthase large subunit
VPFVSKATGVPIAKLAAKVMAGANLEDLDVDEQIPEQVSVKEVVLPFDRLPGSDPRLGPEMKSTGEVMGTADTFGKAYQKAQMCVGKPIPLSGSAVVDLPVVGFEAFFDVSDVEDYADDDAIIEAIRAGEIDLVISRNRDILDVCVEETVTYFSTIESAQAALEAIRHADEPLDVTPIDDRPKMREYWGQPKEREHLRSQIGTLRSIADAGYLDALGAADEELAEFVDSLDTVLETIDDSVLVLGSASDGDDELGTVAAELEERGYDGRLVSELPAPESQSAEQRTATYMLLSEFSIMVDRDPSQRLSASETARAQNNVLARLVPADVERQTTHLLGGHDADVEHIREFEFESDPTEVLDEAIEWAETLVERRRPAGE